MTAQESFTKAYGRVVAVFGKPPDPVASAECWRAVADFPPEVFDVAASRLIKTAQFLPRPAEWVQQCILVRAESDQARRQAAQEEIDRLKGERLYYCPVCMDTGFAYHQCVPGAFCTNCQVKGHLYDHRYVTPCPCRPDNPAWQAKVQKQADRVSQRQADPSPKDAKRTWQRITAPPTGEAA